MCSIQQVKKSRLREVKYLLTQGSGWSQDSTQPVGMQSPQLTMALCFRPAFSNTAAVRVSPGSKAASPGLGHLQVVGDLTEPCGGINFHGWTPDC